MPCHWIKMPDGTVAHVRTSGYRAPKCSCGRPSTKLCDFVVSSPQQVTHKKTCDKPLCDRCAVHAGTDLDFCSAHAEAGRQQQGQQPLFEGAPDGQ